MANSKEQHVAVQMEPQSTAMTAIGSTARAGPLPLSAEASAESNQLAHSENQSFRAAEGIIFAENASTICHDPAKYTHQLDVLDSSGSAAAVNATATPGGAATALKNSDANKKVDAPAADEYQAPVAPTVFPKDPVNPELPPPPKGFGRVAASFQVYLSNVRRKPLLLIGLPFLIFSICVALGVYGVIAGAEKETSDKKSVVRGAALDWAASFQLSFEQTFTPLVTLSIFIKQTPNFTIFKPNFLSIADDIVATLPSGTIQEIQVSPFGIVQAVWPITDALAVSRLGLDIFGEAALRGGGIATIERRDILLNGPLHLLPSNFGAIVRLPIFIQNSSLSETFGTNLTLPTNCTTLCYNATSREKFWGFVTIILLLGDLRVGNDTRLDLIKQKNYRWAMTRPWTSTEVRTQDRDAFMFSNSSKLPVDPVSVEVQISNAVWTIFLSPEEGWRPSWQDGMLVLVVLGSVVVSVMVATIMASWAQQGQLLASVLTSNKKLAATTAHLEEEKLKLDALLVRQYNLLSVLGGPQAKGKGGGASSEAGSYASKEGGITLERIEGMRRQLAVNTNSSTADIESIQTIELLGEGTFGKVYKGLWRGTVVAVKTMVMPANMSGAEKREKMAVMEAAISSSLSHPNIVQTYTYAIRPIKDQTQDVMEGLEPGLLVTTDGTKTVAGNGINASMESSATQANVHSYEVRLVLEYCNKGSLREALDQGAFMGASGLNYRAILDMALDIAKAMLHLHTVNVLHADLKARNVMLKSGGESGTVMAKVADFGLSVKMDVMETHISSMFQGTMTHMAPEIMLEGRVSKAADVYAFGITLWELFTAGHAFKGIPRALMGHQITREALRPRWPDAAPSGLRSLSERCWHHSADCRPDFSAILNELLAMRAAEPGETPPVHVEGPAPIVPNQGGFQVQNSVGGGGASTFAANGLGSAAVVGPASETASQMGGMGMGGGKTTVRQRPLVLPIITESQEDKGTTGGDVIAEDEEEGVESGVRPSDQPSSAPDWRSSLTPSSVAPSMSITQGGGYGMIGTGGGGGQGGGKNGEDDSMMLGGSVMQVMDASEMMTRGI